MWIWMFKMHVLGYILNGLSNEMNLWSDVIMAYQAAACLVPLGTEPHVCSGFTELLLISWLWPIQQGSCIWLVLCYIFAEQTIFIVWLPTILKVAKPKLELVPVKKVSVLIGCPHNDLTAFAAALSLALKPVVVCTELTLLPLCYGEEEMLATRVRKLSCHILVAHVLFFFFFICSVIASEVPLLSK